MARQPLRKVGSTWKPPGKPAGQAQAQDPAGSKGEAALVAGLRAGDAKAFEEVVLRYGPRLLIVGRRILGNEEDARDCVQETFLATHRSIGEFQGRSNLGTWLRRIVTNAALMKLRARRTRPEESIEEFLPKYDPNLFRGGPRNANALTPEELLQRADTRKLVQEAIDRIPGSYRTVLLLRDFEGYSTQETAQLLDTTDGAIKVRLHRARTAMKELLAPLFDEELR